MLLSVRSERVVLVSPGVLTAEPGKLRIVPRIKPSFEKLPLSPDCSSQSRTRTSALISTGLRAATTGPPSSRMSPGTRTAGHGGDHLAYLGYVGQSTVSPFSLVTPLAPAPINGNSPNSPSSSTSACSPRFGFSSTRKIRYAYCLFGLTSKSRNRSNKYSGASASSSLGAALSVVGLAGWGSRRLGPPASMPGAPPRLPASPAPTC